MSRQHIDFEVPNWGELAAGPQTHVWDGGEFAATPNDGTALAALYAGYAASASEYRYYPLAANGVDVNPSTGLARATGGQDLNGTATFAQSGQSGNAALFNSSTNALWYPEYALTSDYLADLSFSWLFYPTGAGCIFSLHHGGNSNAADTQVRLRVLDDTTMRLIIRGQYGTVVHANNFTVPSLYNRWGCGAMALRYATANKPWGATIWLDGLEVFDEQTVTPTSTAIFMRMYTIGAFGMSRLSPVISEYFAGLQQQHLWARGVLFDQDDATAMAQAAGVIA